MFLLEILLEHLPTLLVLTAGVLFVWFNTGRPKGLPPGPRPIWPLGNLLAVGTKPLVRFEEWRRKYGDIFTFYVGQHLIVVLNGYDVLKDALVKQGDHFNDRPKLFFGMLGFGIVSSSGRVWKEQRRFALATLKDFGMGKNMLEGKIKEETVSFLKAMEDLREDNNIVFTNLIETAVSNVICSIVFGKRFEYEDPSFIKYIEKTHEAVAGLSLTSVVLNVFPFLKYIPGDIFQLNKMQNAWTFTDENFLKPAIEEHIKNYDENDINDFISAYIREMRLRKSLGEETSFNTDTLVRVISDLFAGGTETSATTIIWAVIHLIRNPEVQEKCYQEVKEIIGHERLPRMADKIKMPYMEATVTEILRLSPVLPFSTLRSVSYDVCLNGYTIPKGATVIPNLFSVLKDPEVFEKPDAVQPERFLDSEGKFVKREEFVPFALGKRNCIGEALAKMELFLFLTAMIQRFIFEKPENGELPSLEPVLGATMCPKPFKFQATKRLV